MSKQKLRKKNQENMKKKKTWNQGSLYHVTPKYQ